ncbi:MAG: hypothetical protein IT379_38480 [Deltaproteobacteria bacterium]|nr:hypothetical protein [Deltaproteobacteria bacterium]
MDRTRSHLVSLLLLASLAPIAACAADTGGEGEIGEELADDAGGGGKADHAGDGTWYAIRQDFRRCISPICGGYWVRKLNGTRTRCADGSRADECYVADADFSALGDADRSGLALVRGALTENDWEGFGSFGHLTVSRAWRATTDAEPTGSFWNIEDNGIRCVRAPCFSLDGFKLNWTTESSLSGLDLSATGADDDELAAAYEALGGAGVVVTGRSSGSARRGRTFHAQQLYLPIEPVAPDPLACGSDADCTWSVYSHPISTPDECYCTTCPSTLMNVATEDANRASWEAQCSAVRLLCPLAPCARPPVAACIEGRCAVAAE